MYGPKLTNVVRNAPRILAAAAIMTALFLPGAASAQVLPGTASAQDRDQGSDRDRDRMTRIEPGTIIPVRTNETIDVDKRDNQVFTGIVDQDVRGTNGRLAIPKGSTVELIVRVTADNDLVIDVESASVNGQRYALKTDPNRQESKHDDSLVGSIVGAVQGGRHEGELFEFLGIHY
jgi:hypothetical protein